MNKLLEKVSYHWFYKVVEPITTKIHTSVGRFLDEALDEMIASDLANDVSDDEGSPSLGFGAPEYYSTDNQWPMDRVKAGHNQE